jgi:Domain of unknown function (DUF4352)
MAGVSNSFRPATILALPARIEALVALCRTRTILPALIRKECMPDPQSQPQVGGYPDSSGGPGQRHGRAWMPWGVIAIVVTVALSIVGLVIVLGVLGDADVSGTGAPDDESTTPGPTPPPFPQEVEEEPARIGEAAVDGDLIFVVAAVTDDPAVIGDSGLNTEPEGKFVFVTMTTTNQGDSPRSLPSENQYLLDTEGRKASADTDAATYLPEDAQSLFEMIEPGGTVTGIIVFDIPADATPAGLELHDSASSSGVTVALG